MKELLKNWEWKKLGEVTEIIMGQSPPSNTYNDKLDGLPFFQGKAEFSLRFPQVKKFCSKPVRIAEVKDILMSVRAPVGSVNIANQKSCIGRGLCAIRPSAKIDFLYLFHFLKANESRISAKGVGSTFTAINRKDIQRIEIPLPPLPTQHKIVSILERAEKLKSLRQEANEDTNTMIQALFYEMFGDAFKNPHNFEKVNLGKVAQLQGGYAFKSADYKKEGVRLVTISNVHNSRLTWEENTYLLEEYLMEYKDFALNKGDLVIAMTRPIIKSLNTVKLVEIQKSDLPALLNQRVGRFKILSSKINKKYLEYFCYGFEFKKEIEKFSSVSLQPNVSSKQIESIEILVPPISLQNQFASFVEKIESIKEHQTQSTEEINTLFDALMQKAFQGEINI